MCGVFLIWYLVLAGDFLNNFGLELQRVMVIYGVRGYRGIAYPVD
jgi:hypothetical protein